MAHQDFRSLPPGLPEPLDDGAADHLPSQAVSTVRLDSTAGEPVIELLWWAGCPSRNEALADLRAAAADLGRSPDDVVERELRTDDEADELRFAGSPTFRVGGRDLFPLADEPTGLTCRIYRLRDGRPSPTPDPDDLRVALRAALTQED